MRRVALLVVLSTSLAACAGILPGYQPMRGVLVDEHWQFLTEDNERQVFIQQIPIEEPGRKAAYVRFEERENRGSTNEPMLSARSVFDFNCRTGQFRTVSTTYYATQNMKGSYTPTDRGPSRWVQPDTNSIASKAFEAICQPRRPDQNRAEAQRSSEAP